MCFSATASFVAGSGLLACGVATVKLVKARTEFPFALLPTIFGVQQLCEGFLWLSFSHPEYENWRPALTFTFLVFAQIVWPFWVPFSMYAMEKKRQRRNGLKALSIIGALVSVFLASRIFFFPVHSAIRENHLSYTLDGPYAQSALLGIFYLAVTVVPPFVSSIKGMRIIGSLLLLSFIVTKILFPEYVISVWCFFAAAISVGIFIILKRTRKQDEWRESDAQKSE
jgi:hypothetical protein